MKSILKAGAATILFTFVSSVGIGSGNAQSYYTPAPQPNLSNENATVNQPTSPNTPEPSMGMAEEPAYDQYMRLGYAALKTESYPTALTYFRNALSVRPYDRLATISYWNTMDLLQSQSQGESEPISAGTRSEYDRSMQIGYDATEQGDYNTALINFRRALAERPGDHYASQAIRNVSTYLWAEQQASN
ncbi:hypothetical protein ACN4EK_25365 [Pantanalinema rosaneae CENA516]|uniref:hypothetical protein n=1 Tax=Pantanalinema rosaneae TaxID=1620701 RepID=UPI003D6E07A7